MSERSFSVLFDPLAPITFLENYPPKVAPASNLWTTEKSSATKLRMEDFGLGANTPLTVGQMLQLTVRNYGQRDALAYKVEDHWEKITFKQFYNRCKSAAKSFLKASVFYSPKSGFYFK